MRKILGTMVAALLGSTAFTGSAQAILAVSCTQPITGWNFTAPLLPAAGATDFEVFLPGDQVGCVTGGFNSFVSPPNSGGTVATFNPVTNQTVLTFSGPQNPGTSPAPFHFGFSGFVPGFGVGGERLPPLTMEWTFPIAHPFRIGPVGINFFNHHIGVVTDWFVLFVLSEFPDGDGLGNGTDGDETTNYFEFPFQGKSSFNLLGSGGMAELSDAQFFVSPTPIPLDQLNPVDTPPNTALFTALPGFPRLVPEPAAVALLGVGLLGLALVRRRR